MIPVIDEKKLSARGSYMAITEELNKMENMNKASKYFNKHLKGVNRQN